MDVSGLIALLTLRVAIGVHGEAGLINAPYSRINTHTRSIDVTY